MLSQQLKKYEDISTGEEWKGIRPLLIIIGDVSLISMYMRGAYCGAQ